MKKDNWVSELETKVVAPAVAAKCVEADVGDLALSRVRAAWYAGDKALRSSTPRHLTEDEEAPMSSETRAMLDRQWKDTYAEEEVDVTFMLASVLINKLFKEWAK